MKWNDLSMKDRATLILLGVASGVYDIGTIRDTYNEFAEGGPTEEEIIALNQTDPNTGKRSPFYNRVEDTYGTVELPEIEINTSWTPEGLRNSAARKGRQYMYDAMQEGYNTVGPLLTALVSAPMDFNPYNIDVLTATLQSVPKIVRTTSKTTLLNRLAHPIETVKIANIADNIRADYAGEVGNAFINTLKNTKYSNKGDAAYIRGSIEGLKEASNFRRAHELGHTFLDALNANNILLRPIEAPLEYRYAISREVPYDENLAEHFADLFGVNYGNDYNSTKVIRDLGDDYLSRIPVVEKEGSTDWLKPGRPEPLPIGRNYEKSVFTDPNYNSSTTDGFTLIIYRDKILGKDKYGLGDIIGRGDITTGTSSQVKEDILENTINRNIREFTKEGLSPEAAQQYKMQAENLMNNVRVGKFSADDYKKAGVENYSGFYDEDNFISLNTGSKMPLDKIEEHEVRHLTDYKLDSHRKTPVNMGSDFDDDVAKVAFEKGFDNQERILSSAYGDDFSELPQTSYGEHFKKNATNLKVERVTTNRDARDYILRRFRAKKWDLASQDEIIDKLSDSSIFEAVENSNGYGRAYINFLRDNNKLTPDKAKAFRESMKRVGVYAVPITIGAKTVTKNTYSTGGIINNNDSILTPAPIDEVELANRQSWAESRDIKDAISKRGALGLFQIMPNTVKEYVDSTGDKGDIFDPVYNRRVRDWYWNKLDNSRTIYNGEPTDSVRTAKKLAAYNWGIGNLGNFLLEKKNVGMDIYQNMDWINLLPLEPRNYVNFILRNLDTGAHRTNKDYNNRKNKKN